MLQEAVHVAGRVTAAIEMVRRNSHFVTKGVLFLQRIVLKIRSMFTRTPQEQPDLCQMASHM